DHRSSRKRRLMRLRALRTMLRKELTDTIRDRRTLIMTLVLPIVLYPLMFIFMGSIISSNVSRAEREQPTVAVWGNIEDGAVGEVDEELDAKIERRLEVPDDAERLAHQLIRGEKVQLVIAADDGLRLYYSSVEPRSRQAHQRAAEILETLELQDVSTAAERGGDIAGRFVPMLMLVMITGGATFAAIDLTAGEKERGTMQTLLVAPLRPVEMVAAKYLTVVIVALASAALNIGGMAFAIGRQTSAFADLEGTSTAFSLSPTDYLRVLAVFIPAAMVIAGVVMVVSVFARTYREAQSYANPILIVVILAGISSMSEIDASPAIAFVPLLNIVMLLRDLLKGTLAGSFLASVLIANVVYAAGAIVLTARVFESEQVLLGGERPWRDVWARKLGRAVPTGRGAIAFAVVLVVIAYYGSLFASKLDFVPSLLFVQLGLLLGPALIFIVLARFSVKDTLWLRPPTGTRAVGAFLVAGGGWSVALVVASVMAAVFPATASYFEQLEGILGFGTAGLPFGAKLALLALLPAICEEVCFRGVVLSGLRSTGTAAGAVVGSALLFGLFHVSPYHAVPAASLGALFAVTVLATRSIVPGVVGHLIANGLAVVSDGRQPEPWMVAAGLGAVVVGLVILRLQPWGRS
ncbi:MAG: ABC transporter permease subunit, partial [Actinomycetota bacterium]